MGGGNQGMCERKKRDDEMQLLLEVKMEKVKRFRGNGM
jgi:hypothetical protein